MAIVTLVKAVATIMIDQSQIPLHNAPTSSIGIAVEDETKLEAELEPKPITLLVCPPTIAVYFLEENRWSMITKPQCQFCRLISFAGVISLNDIRPRAFDLRKFDELVMPDNVKILCRSFVRVASKSAASAGVGSQGLLALLHGPPGVGKSSLVCK